MDTEVWANDSTGTTDKCTHFCSNHRSMTCAHDMDSSSLPQTPTDDAIIGVKFKYLKSHGDGRGFFREVVRVTDEFFGPSCFAQWSHSKMQHNVVKAWHYHHVQYDWWYCPIGQLETVLFDNRPESPTYKKKLVFRMGDAQEFGPDTLEICVRIPPGVLHGLKVLSPSAHLFYITSETYNRQEEGRYRFDSPLVGHAWGENVIVAENDKADFVPVAKRVVLA
jgi:dTDP-4-dehydrorhamnose 3,5-epimerase